MADPRPVRTPLRIETLAATLEQKLDNEAAVLDLLVAALARGQTHDALWEAFHTAAVRDDKIADLAFCYERLAGDKKMKSMNPNAQAMMLLRAGAYFADLFGDVDGAVGFLERGLQLAPSNAEIARKLTAIFEERGDNKKLGELFAVTAQHREGKAEQIAAYRRAAELTRAEGDLDRAIKATQEILKLDPTDGAARAALEDLFEQAGKLPELARLLEQTLADDPEGEDARSIRLRLLSLYAGGLGEIERAMPHVELTLESDPEHGPARRIAEDLLAHKVLGARAAELLARVHERRGAFAEAAKMLAAAIDQLRGPKKTEAQKKLAALAYERLGDRERAFALDEAVIPLDPGDAATRARFLAVAAALGKQADAIKTLSRAATSAKDAATRARIHVDLADLYRDTGDARKARLTYQTIFDGRADDEAVLRAARAIAALSEAARDTKGLAAALARVAETTTDADERTEATLKLAQILEHDLKDAAGAIAEHKKLLGTSAEGEALDALERLFEAASARADLAAVLERRAAFDGSDDERRDRLMRAAALRTELGDRAAALGAWAAIVERFGPSREAYAQIIPMLEQERRWDDLTVALAGDASLAPRDERPALFGKIGGVKLAKLNDAEGALTAFRAALAIDPREPQSRAAVERLLASVDHRSVAADVLEPIARSEGAAALLTAVLDVRAATSAGAERRAALAEGATIAAAELRDPKRATDLAEKGLVSALDEAMDEVPAWIHRVEELAAGPGEAKRKAAALRAALADRTVDHASLSLLARRSGEALAAAGDVAGALAALRRALAYEPSSNDLVARIDELLRDQGAPEERIALYRAALEHEEDPARRRATYRKIALIQVRDSGSPAEAAVTLGRALDEDPRDREALDALVAIYANAGDHAAAHAALARAMDHADQDDRGDLLVRLAATARAAGLTAQAVQHYRAILDAGGARADEALGAAEEAAIAASDADLLRDVLERRADAATDPRDEAATRDRLGALYAERIGDASRAADEWRRAGDAAERAGDAAFAERSYERALAALADDRDAAERLIALLRARGDAVRLPEVIAVLLRTSVSADEAATTLLSFEPEAPRFAEAFLAHAAAILDRADRDGALSPPLVTALRVARAKLLSADPARQDEAIQALDAVLDEGGAAGEDAAVALDKLLRARGKDAADALRALHAKLVERADPDARVARLAAWAEVEEQTLGDPSAAAERWAQVFALDPSHDGALAARVRIFTKVGDLAGAAEALDARRALHEGPARAAIDLELAELYMGPLDRPLDALAVIAPIVEGGGADPAALGIVTRALVLPSACGAAADLIERAADVDPNARASLLEALLAAPRAPALEDARRRAYDRLLDDLAASPDAALDVALRAALDDWVSVEAWERAEALAKRAQEGDPSARGPAKRVAAAYLRALDDAAKGALSPKASEVDPDRVEDIGRRAVEHHEEWFDAQEEVALLLRRLAEIVPGSPWAFERLKLFYNLSERWDDLFTLYDEAIARAPDKDVQRDLLEDAALAAKDLSGDASRAMKYLAALYTLSRDAKTRSSLERLYERHGRHRPLIDLLVSDLPSLKGAAAQQHRARIAGLQLDAGDVEAAASTLDALLEAPEDPGDRALRDEAYGRLDRILADAGAPAAARRRAGARLAARCQAEGRTADLARVLDLCLALADDPADRAERLRAIATLRLGPLGDQAGALDALSELVVIAPSIAEHRVELADLADRTGRSDRRAEVLSMAAARSSGRLAIELSIEAEAVYRERLGDPARAIALNRVVLDAPAAEAHEALAAARRLDRLLDATGGTLERPDVLDRIASGSSDAAERRAARAEIARISAHEARDLDRAIRALSAILAEDPCDVEAEAELDRALASAGRNAELVTLLEQRAARSEPSQARADITRAAKLYAAELGDLDRAIARWSELRARFGRDGESAAALADLFERSARYADLASLLESEAEAEGEPAIAAELFARAGAVVRDELRDLEAAAAFFQRALGAWPGSESARSGLEDLARTLDPASSSARTVIGALLERYTAMGDVDAIAAILEPRLAIAGSDGERAEILAETARLLEGRGRVEGAFEALLRSFELNPGGLAPEDVARLAEAAGRWESIAEVLEADRDDIPRATRQALSFRTGVALQHRAEPSSSALRARALLGRAHALAPDDEVVLGALASVQRRAPDHELVATLLRLSDKRGGDLACLREAVEVAEGALGDRVLAKTLAEKLLDVAAERWDATSSSAGPASDPAAAASWALDVLARLLREDGPARVADLFLRGARLPFDTSERRRLRLRAAELSEEPAMIGIYSELFDEDPHDPIAGDRLDALYRDLQRRADRIALKERRILAADDAGRKVSLRFELAELLVESGEVHRAIAALIENLDADPTHEPSSRRLAELFESEGRSGDLASLCERSAERAEGAGDAARARPLWARAASIAERDLADAPRAIAAHRRAAALGDEASSEALARLLLGRGDSAAAAEVLHALCETAAPSALAGLVGRLVDALLAAGDAGAARAALERFAPRAENNEGLRARLAELYRQASAWGPLAALIAADAERAPSGPLRAARLREAAALHIERQRDPASAIPLLQQASELTPDDLSVRLDLASALREGGRFADAAAALGNVLAAYGARRPKERALVHFELGRTALASGDRARSLSEFDAAIRIDPGHPGVLLALARLALEEGQIERAARMYRALLLVVRKPKEGRGADISRAEVLFELSELTRTIGEPDRAAEYLESAMESARESSDERDRLMAALRARGRFDLLAERYEEMLAKGEAGDPLAALRELAEIYEAHLGRRAAALGARMEILSRSTPDPQAVAATLALARAEGALDKFLAVASRRASIEPRSPALAGLHLAIAEVADKDLGDADRARDAYRAAEALFAEASDAPRLYAVWDALDALLVRRGDVAEVEALLERRIGFDGDPGAPPSVRAEPLYRLAELRLTRGDPGGVTLVERGIDAGRDSADGAGDLDRAERILSGAIRAGATGVTAREVLRVARAHDRDRLVIAALRALASQGAADGLVEAVAIAERLGEPALAKEILREAVDRPSLEGDASIVWALVALAETLKREGALAEAADLLERAARAAPERERALLFEVASIAAGPLGDLRRAARVLEALRELEPAEREIWQPLADIYRKLGERARLSALLEATAPLVDSAPERARLLLERAKMTLTDDEERAIPMLNEVLDEDPAESEAAALLSGLLERLGRRDDLVALLKKRLDAAKDRADTASISALSLKLGALLEQAWDEDGALDAYHTALDWDPKNRDLLRQILRLAESRDDSVAIGDVMGRLLDVEEGPGAAELALKLAEIAVATGDPAGAQRTLERGFAACPTHEGVREALVTRLTAGEKWAALAAVYVRDADVKPAREEKIASLCAAADLLRSRAGDTAQAAEILERALDIDATDRDVLFALVDALGAIGQHERAIPAISRVIEAQPDDPWLYRSRASLNEALGRDAIALYDLERAYDKSGGSYASELSVVLEREIARSSASHAEDARGLVRSLRIRLAEVLARAGEAERARAELAALLHADARDREALRALAALEEREQRWEIAAGAYSRLLAIEVGEVGPGGGPSADHFVATTLRLADVSEKAARPGDAREALERALAISPASAAVRERLRGVYEALGARRELAALVLEDAAAAPDVATRHARLVHAARLLLDVEGEAARAASILDEARAIAPDDLDTQLFGSDAYAAAGRPDYARAILDAALAAQKGRRTKQAAAILRRLARLDLAMGDRAAAIASLARALDCDAQSAELALELGSLAIESGDLDVATRAYRAITLMKDPKIEGVTLAATPRSIAYYELARAAIMQGDRRKARLMVEKSAAEDPSFEHARVLLDELRAG